MSVKRTNILFNKLGHEIEVVEPLSGADIFNFEINTNYEPRIRKAVGFGN